jgi:chromosome segregation ATPase
MAKSLLQKLNTLIQATVQDAVHTASSPLTGRLLGKNLDKEVAALRKQLAAAEADEQGYLQRQAALNDEILNMDAQTDAAVQAGRDAEARHLIQQIEIKKRQLTMLNSELEQLRMAMSDFLRQLNDLDALVELAKRSDQDAESGEPTLADSLHEAQRRVQVEISESRSQEDSVSPHIELVESIPLDEAAIEQDLAARRSRLAKPD